MCCACCPQPRVLVCRILTGIFLVVALVSCVVASSTETWGTGIGLLRVCISSFGSADRTCLPITQNGLGPECDRHSTPVRLFIATFVFCLLAILFISTSILVLFVCSLQRATRWTIRAVRMAGVSCGCASACAVVVMVVFRVAFTYINCFEGSCLRVKALAISFGSCNYFTPGPSLMLFSAVLTVLPAVVCCCWPSDFFVACDDCCCCMGGMSEEDGDDDEMPPRPSHHHHVVADASRLSAFPNNATCEKDVRVPSTTKVVCPE